MFAEFFQNESCRVQFEQFVNAWIQYALLPATAIVRGCSTGANHAKNCRLTSSDLKTRVAIARSIRSAGRHQHIVVQIGHDPHRAGDHHEDNEHAKGEREYVVGGFRPAGDVQEKHQVDASPISFTPRVAKILANCSATPLMISLLRR